MIKRFIPVIIILAILTAGCQVFRKAKPGSVLFQDDFSDPSSGWVRMNDRQVVVNYVDGQYRIYVNARGVDAWGYPDLKFGDVHIEADAVKAGGPDNNDFGLICRMVDPENFYALIISSDGYYGITKVKSGKSSLISLEALQPSEAIQRGAAANHLRADCIGDTITLYANGEKLLQVVDKEFSSGGVGLLAGAYDPPGTDIYFDNFSVIQP